MIKRALICLLIILSLGTLHAQVAVNLSGLQPDASAMLDVNSLTKGMLVPRMSSAQRIAIVSPAEGLLVYDTDLGSFLYYRSGSWTTLLSGIRGWQLNGNTGTDPVTDFIGTTDNKPLQFRVNSHPAGVLQPSGGYNSAFGYEALPSAAGSMNTAVGAQAFHANVSGSSGTAIGYGALKSNTTGSENVAIGMHALALNRTKSELVAIGDSALFHNEDFISALPNYGTMNTAVGHKTLFSNTKGSENTALGFCALKSNKESSGQTAIGSLALYSDSLSSGNTAVGAEAMETHYSGNNNTAVGSGALGQHQTGVSNVAIGAGSMFYNHTGQKNAAIGDGALAGGQSVSYNVAIGFNAATNCYSEHVTAIGAFALKSCFAQTPTVAIGDSAMYGKSPYAGLNTCNTAVGASALLYNYLGSGNTGLGFHVLRGNTTGSGNTCVGTDAMAQSTTGSYQVAIGDSALYNQVANPIGYYGNTAVGSKVLFSNATGYNNTGLGYRALFANAAGYNNTASGYMALASNTASNNSAFGFNTLSVNTGGANNTAAGTEALRTNGTGNYNTAIGFNALYTNIAGSSNTAVGQYAGYYTNQSNNTSVGLSAGDYFTYSNGTFLGCNAYPNASGYSNCMALGYNARVDASNKVVIGNSAVTSIGGYAGWTTFPSDRAFKRDVTENVPGLDFIRKLRPVTYYVDTEAIDAALNGTTGRVLRFGEQEHTVSAEERKAASEKSQVLYTGFIAQEVETAARETGYDFSGVDAPKTPEGHYGLRYAEFVVPLVKAVQEQQELIESQTRKLTEQQALILRQQDLIELQRESLEVLKDRVSALESKTK